MESLQAGKQRLEQVVLNGNGHVFDAKTGHSYTLNPTAQIALLLLRDGHSAAEVARVLAERCGTHPAVVAAGLDTFINQIDRYFQ
jgi:hypothetical protein